MTVVVGYEGRREGRDAVALGALLARAMDEPLLVACVHPSPETALGRTDAELRATAERTAAEGAAGVSSEIEVTHIAIPGRSAAQGLHDFAEERDPTALVVGSSHRGPLGRVIAGRVASRLFSGGPCPAVVAPRGFARRPNVQLHSIGVGFDDSPLAWNQSRPDSPTISAASATWSKSPWPTKMYSGFSEATSSGVVGTYPE